ncbi:MAG: hypothetical protein FDZ70_08855 [Actinobacteria bacterium]|nr:MAG: hypothetical protein FDZ70_08855 [Actinomycetota bacterium]
MGNRFDEWVRHYENLLWQVTAAFFAVDSALLVLWGTAGDGPAVPIFGLVLTVLMVYSAASIRELRHGAVQRLDEDVAALFLGRRLHGWWAFILLSLGLVLAWSLVLLDGLAYYDDPFTLLALWYALCVGAAGGVLVLGFLFRRPRTPAHD